MTETTKTRYVPLAGGAGAGVGTAVPMALQSDGIVALLSAAASGAIVAGVLLFVLASRGE